MAPDSRANEPRLEPRKCQFFYINSMDRWVMMIVHETAMKWFAHD